MWYGRIEFSRITNRNLSFVVCLWMLDVVGTIHNRMEAATTSHWRWPSTRAYPRENFRWNLTVLESAFKLFGEWIGQMFAGESIGGVCAWAIGTNGKRFVPAIRQSVWIEYSACNLCIVRLFWMRISSASACVTIIAVSQVLLTSANSLITCRLRVK